MFYQSMDGRIASLVIEISNNVTEEFCTGCDLPTLTLKWNTLYILAFSCSALGSLLITILHHYWVLNPFQSFLLYRLDVETIFSFNFSQLSTENCTFFNHGWSILCSCNLQVILKCSCNLQVILNLVFTALFTSNYC